MVFEPLPPRAPLPPLLFPLFPRHPTPSADYNPNVLCRIPGHRLALIPSLIIPTTDYVLHLEHEPLSCGAGINKHTQDIPLTSPDSEGASIYFTLSAVASCLSRIVTRSTLDRCSFCCSFHSWSVPKFSLRWIWTRFFSENCLSALSSKILALSSCKKARCSCWEIISARTSLPSPSTSYELPLSSLVYTT